MSERMVVTDPVYERAKELAAERDVSAKEAVAIMVREAGYDV